MGSAQLPARPEIPQARELVGDSGEVDVADRALEIMLAGFIYTNLKFLQDGIETYDVLFRLGDMIFRHRHGHGVASCRAKAVWRYVE